MRSTATSTGDAGGASTQTSTPCNRGRAGVLADERQHLGHEIGDAVFGLELQSAAHGQVVDGAGHARHGALGGVDLGGGIVVQAGRAARQLQVGAGHRDRRAQLVGDLLEEAALVALARRHLVDGGRRLRLACRHRAADPARRQQPHAPTTPQAGHHARRQQPAVQTAAAVHVNLHDRHPAGSLLHARPRLAGGAHEVLVGDAAHDAEHQRADGRRPPRGRGGVGPANRRRFARGTRRRRRQASSRSR